MEVVLKLENFEGPLDLLLQLIEKKKVKIAEIQISELIDEYLELISQVKEENLELKAEFLVVASELLEMKALSLLKLEKEKEREEELRGRLEEYKIFKELGVQLSLFEKEYNISYSRGEGRKIIKKINKEYDLLHFGSSDLYRMYQKYSEQWEDKEYLELSLDKAYSLREEMDQLYLRIYQQEYSFSELFELAENRMHLIYIFLAILELYKDGKIEIEREGVRKCLKAQ